MATTTTNTRKLREAISELSTGSVTHTLQAKRALPKRSTYYENVAEWHNLLEGVLENYGYTTEEPCPAIHTDYGRGVATLVIDPAMASHTPVRVSYIHYQWYRMPSLRWEVVCYPA